MAEYIEREAVKEAIGFINLHFVACGEEKSLLDVINEVPAADVAPVVHAKWVHNINDEPYCEACGEPADIDEYEYGVRGKVRYAERDFCPNCGARMDGE